MIDKPQSPYKITPTTLREVCFDVSEQDIREFKFRFATHGSIDAICATLFYHFMLAVKSNDLPLATSDELETSNNLKFNQMISQLTFPF